MHPNERLARKEIELISAGDFGALDEMYADDLIEAMGRPGGNVTQRDEFLEATLPRLLEADTAFHNGDSRARSAVWSQNDPVTLFGAALTKSGWAEGRIGE